MFTGIIQHLGTVMELCRTTGGAALRVEATEWDHVPESGQSIAVNGCCLTVNTPPATVDGLLCFDLSRQTLMKSTLGELTAGDQVNLEHAMRASDLFGGHIVQGHVDGVGRVTEVHDTPEEWRLRIEAPPELRRYICEKGSIAVNGVSLTIAATHKTTLFEVVLIPTTLALTNLRRLTPGSNVNIEVDYLARITVNWLERQTYG